MTEVGNAERQSRVIVVLGYSDGGAGTLHPICAARLDYAAALATEHDVVVLSGWARVPGTRSEADLMAAAWTGVAKELVVDPDARTTVGNAANALDDVLRTNAKQVVVVTSRWHRPRAAAVFRSCLRRSTASIRVVGPSHRGRIFHWLREIPCWVLLPIQLFRRS